MAPSKEKGDYLDDKIGNGHEHINGRQPEEIAMVPKNGWGDGKGHYQEGDAESEANDCGIGYFKPPKLQKFKKLWLFALLSGLISLFSDHLNLYLNVQFPFLKKQFDLKEKEFSIITLSQPIATLVSVLFLSFLARRVHIPRVLAITSIIAACSTLFMVIPHIHSQLDLAKPPRRNETEQFTMEKVMFDMPSCVYERIPKEIVQKMSKIMMEQMLKQQVEQQKKNKIIGGGGGDIKTAKKTAAPTTTTTTTTTTTPKPKPAGTYSL